MLDIPKHIIDLGHKRGQEFMLRVKQQGGTTLDWLKKAYGPGGHLAALDISTPIMKSRREQYRHPNWQKTRLLVFQRDLFTCTRCGETEVTLHAHHLMYIRDKPIWEVPINQIITLCEDCHSEEHGKDLRIK